MTGRSGRACFAIGLLFSLLACRDSASDIISVDAPKVAPVRAAVMLGRLAHDRQAFTQGFVVQDGSIYESTGGRGSSTLRRIDLATGETRQRIDIPEPYFAEGIAALDDRIYQLTWQERTAFVYDLASLDQLRTFGYRGEGWGLTTDGTSLILSDGSDRLQFLDPATFGRLRTLTVRDGPHPVHNLNELEWVGGEIWANVWHEDEIARIDPSTGTVIGWVDLTGILPGVRFENEDAVPNGIAFDEQTGKLYVTGKLWPEIYQIELPR
jgi:glutamine cyclotransferase